MAARRSPRRHPRGSSEFRARFAVPDNRVRGIRTVDIASAAYPVKFAFGGAVTAANPYINILNRLVVVQYEDSDGDLKTLVYEPTVTEGPAEAPFYEQLLAKYGEFLSYKVFPTFYNDVPQALEKAGVRPEDVDFISSTTCTSRTSASCWARPSRRRTRSARCRPCSRTRS